LGPPVLGAARAPDTDFVAQLREPQPSPVRRGPDQRPPEGVPVEANTTGSSTKKVEPIPSLDSIQILPPIRWTNSRQM
jgi:hypothetical protein